MTSTAPSTKADNDYSRVFLFFGIALVVLGILSVIASVFVTISTVVLLGALLIAAGIAQVIHGIRSSQGGKMLLNILSGIAYAVAGGFLIYNPLAGALSLTLLMSAFFIVAGILRCAYAVAHFKQPMWGWFLVGGVANLVLGAMIAYGWPDTALWIIGLFVGIEMLMHGMAWIALSGAMRAKEKPAT